VLQLRSLSMGTAVAAALIFGCAGTAASPVMLVGNQAVEASADSDSAGAVEAFQATAAASGTAGDVMVYVDTTPPTTVTVGLYADAAGHPGALLAQGTLAAPKGAAWNDVPLTPSPSLSAGTVYWIAILSPAGAGTVHFRDRKSSGSSESSSATGLSALPAAWSTGTRYTDAFLSAYVLAGTADTSPPSQPQGFAATASAATTISTSWSASTDNVGVTGYNVYVGTQKIGSPPTASYTFSSLACGTTYTLGVEASDAAGNVSPRSTLSATTAACADTTAPTAPGSFATTGTTATAISTSWSASTDNVGVTGYKLYVGAQQVGTTTSLGYTFGSLACGQTYTLGVAASDAAGNLSARTTLTTSTPACSDTSPPSAPSGLMVTSSTPSTISLLWSASSDNVGVAGYEVRLDGQVVTTVTATSYTFGGLTCSTLHTVAVKAYDSAGNASAATSLAASTGSCPDTAPPTVSLTSPAAGASLSGAVTLTAAASDNVGVATVRFAVDGTPVGPVLTASPYTWTWDSRSAPNGSHQISATAADSAGNTTAAPAVTATTANTLDTSNALKAVVAGPGFVDASTREVVRTSDDRVYLFVADDTAERTGSGPGVIHAYRADQTGIPTSFTEVDSAHKPTATGSTHVLGAPDVRLDRSGIVHLAYVNDTNRNVVYQTFSTLTNNWGPTQILGTNGAVITSAILREGNVALVLDASDAPRVVYSTGSALVYRSDAGGSWSAAQTVATGSPIHPQLAADAAGALYLSWLQDGTSPSIHYRQLPSGGAWSADEAVATSDVLNNSNSDQGPSIVVTSSGVPYILYVSASKTWTNGANYGAVRVRYRTGTGWALDATPTDLLTHTPQIYAQNGDVYAFLGHDTSIHFGYGWQDAGGAWSPYKTLYAGANVDGSASLRWDPQRETDAQVIDAAFYDEDINDNKTYLPRAYYMAVLPRGAQPSQGPPPPDTVPPTVSLSAPAASARVSGSVTVSASASDNVGVAGVQFTLDGAPLGNEDTTSPFAVTWNTTSATSGTHVLAAVARDAAGNKTTAAPVTVTVDNSAPGDTSPPTVSITAPSTGTIVSGTVTVAGSAADNVGVAGVQFTLDGIALGTEDTTAPYSVAWDTTTAAAGTHVIGATARDAAGNRTSATTVSVSVTNAQPVVLLGDQTIETGTDSDSGGQAEAFSSVATATGTLSSIRVYVDSGSASTKLVLGIYAANGSHPGALLTQGTLNSPASAAWNTVAVPSVSITAGATYWFALLSPAGNGTVRFRDRPTGGACEASAQSTLATLPSSWTSGAAYRNAPVSAYGG
jgi:chitodextrinase